jgi:hypothetical protein
MVVFDRVLSLLQVSVKGLGYRYVGYNKYLLPGRLPGYVKSESHSNESGVVKTSEKWVSHPKRNKKEKMHGIAKGNLSQKKDFPHKNNFWSERRGSPLRVVPRLGVHKFYGTVTFAKSTFFTNLAHAIVRAILFNALSKIMCYIAAHIALQIIYQYQ